MMFKKHINVQNNQDGSFKVPLGGSQVKQTPQELKEKEEALNESILVQEREVAQAHE